MKNRLEALSFQRTLDRFPGYLLPPRTSFEVAHDEILVVNARELKMKLPSTYCRLPHQTGVTERSIGGDDWGAADNVLDQMVVGHESHRICDGFAVD